MLTLASFNPAVQRVARYQLPKVAQATKEVMANLSPDQREKVLPLGIDTFNDFRARSIANREVMLRQRSEDNSSSRKLLSNGEYDWQDTLRANRQKAKLKEEAQKAVSETLNKFNTDLAKLNEAQKKIDRTNLTEASKLYLDYEHLAAACEKARNDIKVNAENIKRDLTGDELSRMSSLHDFAQKVRKSSQPLMAAMIKVTG